MYKKLVLNFIIAFLALLGAEPIEGGSEIQNHGPFRVWIVAGVLPPVNKDLSEMEAERLLKIYCQLCRQFPDIIDVRPYDVKIYADEGRQRSINAFGAERGL